MHTDNEESVRRIKGDRNKKVPCPTKIEKLNSSRLKHTPEKHNKSCTKLRKFLWLLNPTSSSLSNLQNKPKNIHMELGRVFTVKNMIKTGHTSTVNGKWNWAHHNISAVCFPVVVVNIALCHE